MRFYGMSPRELDEMSLEDYWMCNEAMDRIEASERLMDMQAASAPYMQQKDVKSIVNKLKKISDPVPLEERAMTHEEMARILNG